MIRALIVAAIAATCAADCLAAKPKLACYEAPGSRSTMCIDEANVSVNGDLRASALYSGGPKGVDKVSATFIVDCKRGVATMQDARGVNIAGAESTKTAASRALTRWMCEATPAKKDPSLRQF